MQQSVVNQFDPVHLLLPDFSPVLDALAGPGYFVGENFWSSAWVDAAIDASMAELKSGQFHPATIGKGNQAQRNESIRSDQIYWLEPGQCSPVLQTYLAALEVMRVAINRDLMLGLHDVEVMAAHYPPGARYGRHFDRFKVDDARTVTTIFYLNKNWQNGDGGELRIYLPDGKTLDVPPKAGTMVTFLSADLEHEVLTTHTERLTLTGWYRRRLAL